MQKNILLENPKYEFLRSISLKIPFHIRQKIKNKSLGTILDFFKWLIVDMQRPKYFHPYGLYFYTGLPGTGKTIFMTYTLERLRQKYGNAIYIGTNYGYIHEDFKVESYLDVIKVRDKPTIIGYDEIQNDFDARNWANLDDAFSERITQSRKIEGLMILATAQRFSFVDRRLRQLTHSVYECRTFKNRLTTAKIYEPELKEKIEGGQYVEYQSNKTKGFKLFTQSDYIRNLYNSYQILEQVASRLSNAEQKEKQVIQDLKALLTTTPPR